ncbi:MAG TPA: TatD family hydrolase [Terriglobales bacterium]|nr:TatD family hydrolase [Terriglobales bacterium]
MSTAPDPSAAGLIDSHCHLDERRFAEDRDQVIARAFAAGLAGMITVGASEGLQANFEAVAIAKQYPHIRATVGIHPHEASIVTDEILDKLGVLAQDPMVVAIGETGLDYYYDNSPRPVQQAVFRQFIAMARQQHLPLSIHLRDAYDDALAILAEERAGEIGGVIHCFSGNRGQGRAFLDLNFDLSFSGVITFKNADELRAVAREVPSDRYLVETDAPFLAPVPRRGKRNEPAWVAFTAAAIAEVRGTGFEEVAQETSANTRRRFRLAFE